MFNGLPKKQKTIVREAVEEQRRRGKFRLAFPCDRFTLYKPFFEEERPINLIMDKVFKELRLT